MTREKAERLIGCMVGAIDANKCSREDRASLIMNIFTELGMLKLDEPKPSQDIRKKFSNAVLLASSSHGGVDELWSLLDTVGLKIVEK